MTDQFVTEKGEAVYRGKYLHVTTEKKENVTYERVYVRNGVSVIPVTSDGKIRLIKEGDWDSGNVKIKPVSGYIHDGEDALLCARRELEEEMGMTAGQWDVFSVSKSENPSVQHTQMFYVVQEKFGTRETAFALMNLALQLKGQAG